MADKYVASIDLGSNTFKLRIAKKGKPLEIIHAQEEAVFIGKDSYSNNRISDESLVQAQELIKKFKEQLDHYPIHAIDCVATEAIRRASNSNKILDSLGQDLSIRTIDGLEEAALIFKGVKGAGVLGKHNSLILDIGGGSVECCIANKEKIYWKSSYPIGVSRALEENPISSKLKVEERDSLEHFFSEGIKGLLHECQKHEVADLVGCAGSFDTWRKMLDSENTNQSFYAFSAEALENCIQTLLEIKRSQRLTLNDLVKFRVDTILPAGILVAFLIKSYTFKKIYQCAYALPEGLVFALNEE